MGLQTTVGIAKVGTNSLRATIPEGVVSYLDIHDGDKLDWRMEIAEGKKVVLVTKAEPYLEDALDSLAGKRRKVK
jgi:hypothetical protein